MMASVQGKEKEKLVIEWKFNSLDSDTNSVLDKSEYTQFRKLIKKVIQFQFTCINIAKLLN